MTHPELTLTERRPFQTQRRDTWWLQPLAVFVGLGAVHCLCHLSGF